MLGISELIILAAILFCTVGLPTLAVVGAILLSKRGDSAKDSPRD